MIISSDSGRILRVSFFFIAEHYYLPSVFLLQKIRFQNSFWAEHFQLSTDFHNFASRFKFKICKENDLPTTIKMKYGRYSGDTIIRE